MVQLNKILMEHVIVSRTIVQAGSAEHVPVYTKQKSGVSRMQGIRNFTGECFMLSPYPGEKESCPHTRQPTSHYQYQSKLEKLKTT